MTRESLAVSDGKARQTDCMRAVLMAVKASLIGGSHSNTLPQVAQAGPAGPQVAPTPVPPLCDVKLMIVPPQWEVKEKTGEMVVMLGWLHRPSLLGLRW